VRAADVAPPAADFSHNVGFRINVTPAESAFRLRAAAHQQIFSGEQARHYDQDDY
jgi:hypothetical protein